MGKRALTDDQERQIAARVAAGESTRSVSRSLGVTHQTVRVALGRTQSAATEGQPTTSPPGDEFEAAQLRIFEAGCRLLEDPELSPESYAKVAKATNDTIKALRQYRTLTKAAKVDDGGGNASAEWVRDKLRRMLEGPRVAEATPAQDESEQATGTHGPVSR